METKVRFNEGKKLEFLNKGPCGIWLIWIGTVIILGTSLGGSLVLNPLIFAAGYGSGFFIIFKTLIVKKHLSCGENSAFQKKMANASILVMFILMILISRRYFGTNNYRMIWLGAFIATAIHFVPFSTVHGRLLLLLSVVLFINACIGIIYPNIAFNYIGIIDGLLKILFGAIMLVTRKLCF